MDCRWRVPTVGTLIQYGRRNLDLIVNPASQILRAFATGSNPQTYIHPLSESPCISLLLFLALTLPWESQIHLLVFLPTSPALVSIPLLPPKTPRSVATDSLTLPHGLSIYF